MTVSKFTQKRQCPGRVRWGRLPEFHARSASVSPRFATCRGAQIEFSPECCVLELQVSKQKARRPNLLMPNGAVHTPANVVAAATRMVRRRANPPEAKLVEPEPPSPNVRHFGLRVGQRQWDAQARQWPIPHAQNAEPVALSRGAEGECSEARKGGRHGSGGCCRIRWSQWRERRRPGALEDAIKTERRQLKGWRSGRPRSVASRRVEL